MLYRYILYKYYIYSTTTAWTLISHFSLLRNDLLDSFSLSLTNGNNVSPARLDRENLSKKSTLEADHSPIQCNRHQRKMRHDRTETQQ